MNASQHVLVVASGKGGVGKTAVAANIAAEIASEGHRVLLADFDPQGTAALIFRQPSSPGVYNVLNDEADIRSEMIQLDPDRWQVRPANGGELYLLPGDNQTTAAAIGMYMARQPLSLVADLLHPLITNGVFDFIVLDTPPSVHSMAPYTYPAAGYAIVPTDCGLEGVDGFFRTIKNIKNAPGADTEVIAVVPDRIPHNTLLHDRMIGKLHREFGDLVCPPIMTRDTWAKASFKGMALGVYQPRSKAYSEFKFVYRNVVRALRARGIELEKELAV